MPEIKVGLFHMQVMWCGRLKTVCGEDRMLNQPAGIVTSAASAIYTLIMTSHEIEDLTVKCQPDVKRDIGVILLQRQEDVSIFAHIYSSYMFSQSRFIAKKVQWIGGLWTAHKAAGGAE